MTATLICDDPAIVYEITPADLLMLGRAAQYEDRARPDAVIWTYAQRRVVARGRISLARMVESHSQPLSPRWRRDGAFCAPGGRFHGREECKPSALDRRDRAARATWDDLDANVRDAVERFAAGTLINPVPGAVDFAASNRDGTDTKTGYLRRNPGGAAVLRTGNLYVANRFTKTWTADHVRVVPTNSPAAREAFAEQIQREAADAREARDEAAAPSRPRSASTSRNLDGAGLAAAVVALFGVLALARRRTA